MGRLKWKPIPGYEGHYEVSNTGRVRSVDKTVRSGPGSTRVVKGRERKLYHNDKYLQVDLWQGNKREKRYVHQLVAELFVGPKPDRHEVCHKDGDAHNNCASNLRWGTRSSNAMDTIRHGKHNNFGRVE